MKETKLQKEDLSDMVAEHAAKQKVYREVSFIWRFSEFHCIFTV